MFTYFVKTGQILEDIISECLDLPPNFLKEYNNDRSWDFMVTLRYKPATETENNGITEHEDGNLITMVLQEDIGGLEVCKNGEWIPVIPSKGTLVVNIGDVIQVTSLTLLILTPTNVSFGIYNICYNYNFVTNRC